MGGADDNGDYREGGRCNSDCQWGRVRIRANFEENGDNASAIELWVGDIEGRGSG